MNPVPGKGNDWPKDENCPSHSLYVLNDIMKSRETVVPTKIQDENEVISPVCCKRTSKQNWTGVGLVPQREMMASTVEVMNVSREKYGHKPDINQEMNY
jgi:hypothetical protein